MTALADLHPAALYGLVVALGLLVGSFLNVVILRLPARLFHDWRCQCRELLELEPEGDPPPPGIALGRSRCRACGQGIRAFDNIPLLSWLILRGRCRSCGAPISARYPIVEALTALLSVAVIAALGPTWAGLAGLVFTWALIAGSGIDLDHKLLPDQITLPLVWLGLLLNVDGLFVDLPSAVIGAAAGYLVLWAVFHLFRLATGKEGMGYGDFKLLAAIGAWFGWQVLPTVILLASAVGALIGLVLIALRRMGREVPIAFGPFLAAAGWLVLVGGDRVVDFWVF
ncbi:prepilin peptidase [Wenzhouxiangella sp. XN79A]|uniref:prepilin peptidase n=1 Tax=Wenzhouxiangella sp. XN79A TaxID=2724193 RepID=UPI00144A70D8|nr:A24 family peptidase [Wenzhouxiangella sp. XN79A]NKI34687.1 prepilin peptidase [Wenzhouxiangella sp. XN79A]